MTLMELRELSDLDTHLGNRPAQLRAAQRKGVKVVGFFPGNYVPEEIIYASGALPICLARGGSPEPVDAALTEVPDVICPFVRAQVGERLLKTNPYYGMIDMLVAPITCQHLKKAGEIWEYHGDKEIFKLGVPHQNDAEFSLEYYADRLRVMKDRLEALTGNEITDEKLGEAITLYNRIRGLLREVSLLRRAAPPPISSLEFVKLNHASFYADPVFFADVLDSVYHELQGEKAVTKAEAPRLLLLGPNVADGDYKVLGLVAAAGGEIVAEELCEGIRYYWHDIENEGDLRRSLARGYLIDRLPCAFIRRSAKKRLDFALKLVQDFDVSGIIWYEILQCEVYNAESYFFAQRMREHNVPMLILESDYGTADVGQLRTRIEAFIEQIRKAGDND
ncbi:MAG TPA: 2-hydroxyacyl-CoA dehydratase [Dehalococcoidia bacterium]|nr:2-hydroxyacyl-CoA dehydratase [Dehalococcoidia bacterium]